MASSKSKRSGSSAKVRPSKAAAAGKAKPEPSKTAATGRDAARAAKQSASKREASKALASVAVTAVVAPPAAGSTALAVSSSRGAASSLSASGQASILVTGATGFLGAHLVRLLATRSDPRRIRTLQTSAPAWLGRLGVETVKGSVTSAEDVKRALAGVKEVYHLAGMVSYKEEDAHKMYALHVDGTRLLCQAAVEAGVRRMVMASTSGTIAVSKQPDASLDETCATPLEIIARWPYYASKAYQEETARRALGDKVELVTVNPSALYGPGDDRLSSTRVILQFLGREIMMTPAGGLSFVDVRDVAAALPVAMAKGRAGERYLLGGANWSFEELFGRLARMSKVPAPLLKTSGKWPLLLTRAQAFLYRQWDKSPPIEPAAVDIANHYWYFDSRKAEAELGFVPRDPTDTLFDTLTYVRERFLDGFKGALSRAGEGGGSSPDDLADEEAFEASMPS